MNVVAHNTQTVELKAKRVLTFLDGIEQGVFALHLRQPKFTVIAPNCNVITIS